MAKAFIKCWQCGYFDQFPRLVGDPTKPSFDPDKGMCRLERSDQGFIIPPRTIPMQNQRGEPGSLVVQRIMHYTAGCAAGSLDSDAVEPISGNANAASIAIAR